MDTKTSFPGGDKPEYVPENYDGKFRGPIQKGAPWEIQLIFRLSTYFPKWVSLR